MVTYHSDKPISRTPGGRTMATLEFMALVTNQFLDKGRTPPALLGLASAEHTALGDAGWSCCIAFWRATRSRARSVLSIPKGARSHRVRREPHLKGWTAPTPTDILKRVGSNFLFRFRFRPNGRGGCFISLTGVACLTSVG